MLLAARDAGVEITDPVLVDLPGWGDGTLSEAPDAATLDAVCELVRTAAHALGYERWHVVGHSMGGFIAMHLAARWPEEVLSVVTVSGTTWSVVDSVEHPVLAFRAAPGFVMLWRVMGALAALGEARLGTRARHARGRAAAGGGLPAVPATVPRSRERGRRSVARGAAAIVPDRSRHDP